MIHNALNNLIRYIEKEDFKGYDPYDALNSPALRILSFRSKWLRILFTQLLRRCPINFRPLLGIQKGYNPKGLGLFLESYSKLYAVERDDGYLERIGHLLVLLEKYKSRGCHGNGWGYNFDWQSKAAWRPRGTPTLVNTAFIGHALLDCYELTGNRAALDMALPIKAFILNDLNRKQEGDAFCFSYTPVDHDYVHNANMLGASVLIRLYKIEQDPEALNTALASLAYSMKYQHAAGFWYYAETDIQRWIDSFHTGFNLQALRYFLKAGFARHYHNAYEKGVEFYATAFFLVDGTPAYYPHKIYPIDIHCPAQAVYFFSGMGDQYSALTDRILGWMLNNMADRNGFFYFRKTMHVTNKIPYMRWSQAWAFHALTEYLTVKHENRE